MTIFHISPIKKHPCFSDILSIQSNQHKVVCIVLTAHTTNIYSIYDIHKEENITYIYIGVNQSFDFSPDEKLKRLFLMLIKQFSPQIIHVQLFAGINVFPILQACSQKSIKKIITLHTHFLFCLPGTYFDKNHVCNITNLNQCTCNPVKVMAKNKNLSLTTYNQLRKKRLGFILTQSDTIICCSHWQKKTLQQISKLKKNLVVLHYGVKLSTKEKVKTKITKEEVLQKDLDWNTLTETLVQYQWGTKLDHTTLKLYEEAGKDIKKIKTILGKNFKKFMSIIKRPSQKITKKSPLPVFGYLGTLWFLKGIDVLLKAISQIKHLDFKVLMSIRFNRNNKQDILQIKKLLLFPQIQIIVNLDRRNFYKKFFSQIDYLIIPSLWEETGPMTLFESFYFKIPVIISNHPSIVEKTIPNVNAFVFKNEIMLSQIMENIIHNKISLKQKSDRKFFPIQTPKMYAANLERIYSGKY